MLKYLRKTKDNFIVYGGSEALAIDYYTYASFQTDKDESLCQLDFIFV